MTVGIGVRVPKSLVQASSLVGILAGYGVGSTTFTPSSVPSRLPNLPTLPPATYCTQYLANGKQLLVTKTAATCPILSASNTTSASTEVATYNPGGASSLGDVDPSDNECTAFREQVVVYGEVTWKPVEESVRENECDQYCHAKWDEAVAHGKVASAGCMLDDPIAWTEFNSTWQTAKGKCLCDVPVIDTIVEDFVKSLPAVAEITCKVWYTAISSVLEVGLNALPGVGQAVGAALTLAYQAAQVAAYTYENKQDAANAFTNWAQNPSSQHMVSGSSTWGMDKLCGNKYTPPQAEKIFGDFSIASGAIGIPKLWSGALRAWPPPYPKGSNSLDEMLGYIDGLGGKPRPKGNRPGNEHPGHEPKSHDVPKSRHYTSEDPKSAHPTSDPVQTKPDRSSRPASAKSCSRRGNRPRNDKDDDECNDGKVTITKVQKSVPAKNPKTIEATCTYDDWPQACAHYYSAIYANPKEPGKSTFTCDPYNNHRIPQGYTELWNPTQHNDVWLKFTTDLYEFRGVEKELECDRDEYAQNHRQWSSAVARRTGMPQSLFSCPSITLNIFANVSFRWPPAYFVPEGTKDKSGTKDKDPEWGQRIRWIPGGDNRGVASLWNSFCADHDGGFLNGQREGKIKAADKNRLGKFIGDVQAYETRKLNHELVDYRRAKIRKEEKRGTVTKYYDVVTFSQPVFKIVFDWGNNKKPARENNWRLDENPCWPKMIVPKDPGFVLLANDPWYQEHPKLDPGVYKDPPDWDLFDQVNEERKKMGLKLVADDGMPKDKREQSPQPDDNPAKAPKKGDGSGKGKGKGKGKGSSSDSGSGKGRASGSRRKRLELIDHRIHLRDDLYNTTRPLTDEELRHNVEVTDCADRRCSREQEEVAADQDDSLIIPGVGPPSKPSTNIAVPTLVTVTTPPRSAGRSSVSPDLPVITATNRMQD